MKTRTLVTAISAVLIGTAALSGAVFAKGKPPGGETAANNLSFPLILSDNVTPAALPADGSWRFATITAPETQCIGEAGVTPGTPVPADVVCYYGRHVTVVSETGEVVLDGEPCPSSDCKVWWLQKRGPNFWKALSTGHYGVGSDGNLTPLVVSAVDVGDLLESSPKIATRQIRVEFNMLQNVDAADEELGQYVVSDWTDAIPAPCVLPSTGNASLGCFAALRMSGAVPGTEQSGNEMQGTDFGPGPDPGLLTGTRVLVDPNAVKGADALVYSRCARLVIQKITGNPAWDPATGRWTGVNVGAPVAETAAYGAWGVEITSGGSIVYGYNWNAKSVPTGTYRLTFVLDGNDEVGPRCTTALLTKFDATGTVIANPGEANPSYVIPAGDSRLNGGDEGGLAYIDLQLTTKGGGGGRPGGGGGGRP